MKRNTSQVLQLTDRNFEDEVSNSEMPVLVDFWASWCPPCKAIEPLLYEIASEYDGKIKNERIIIGRKVFGEQKNTFNPIKIKFTNKNLNLDCSKILYILDDIVKDILLQFISIIDSSEVVNKEIVGIQIIDRLK